MNILVAGSTGFIGRPLCAALANAGHRVSILSRSRFGDIPQGAVEAHIWNTDNDGADIVDAVATADAVVNLAGKSIAGGRWTSAYKRVLLSSRLETTRSIVNAIGAAGKPGVVLLNASAIGYYGDRGDEDVNENSDCGTGFLASLCRAWEYEALEAKASGGRVVLLRTGIVLGEGGALDKMIGPYKYGAGGPIGNGGQWISWIHLEDEIGIIKLALTNPKASGPINLTGPEPVRSREFAAMLGSILRKPAFLRTPAFAIKLALGEFGETILGGQRVMPDVARQLGYQWKYPDLETALRAALHK